MPVPAVLVGMVMLVLVLVLDFAGQAMMVVVMMIVDGQSVRDLRPE